MYGGRLALSEAADEGSAPAALALGATLDPNETSRLGKLGASPDVNKAREWYVKAKELGAFQAQSLLNKLPK